MITCKEHATMCPKCGDPVNPSMDDCAHCGCLLEWTSHEGTADICTVEEQHADMQMITESAEELLRIMENLQIRHYLYRNTDEKQAFGNLFDCLKEFAQKGMR